jgi:imidazolonepropionase-like amidohydrolase
MTSLAYLALSSRVTADGNVLAVSSPPATLLLKNIHTLTTFNDELGEISKAAIFIRGNAIEWVGQTSALPEELGTADEVIDMSTHVVIPGTRTNYHRASGWIYM